MYLRTDSYIVENEVIKVSSLVNDMNVATSSLVAGARLNEMRKWLSPQDPSSNHNNAVSLCHGGTGQWLIQGKTFVRFKDGEIPFLWLNGLPGCGKTVLSSSIIEDLEHSSSKLSLRKLYFYFDFNDTRKQTLESALRSLLWQASIYPGASAQVLAQLYDSCGRGGAQPSVTRLSESLGKELLLQDTVIVIDALDECTTRSDLLSWLSRLTRHDTGSVRVIFTSRKDQDIQVGLESWLESSAIVPLQEQIVDEDIGAYVRHRLQNDAQLQRWRGHQRIQSEIEAKLMDGANGMHVRTNAGNMLSIHTLTIQQVSMGQLSA